MLNTSKLDKELKNSGISISGCNSNGIVWDTDGNEIQDRADVAAVIAAHDPTPEPEPIYEVFDKPINDDPDLALDEAIAEMEKGIGNPKSIALIALSMAKYLKSKKAKLK